MAINAFDKRSFAQYQPLTAEEIMMPARIQYEKEMAIQQGYGEAESQLAAMKYMIDNESENSQFRKSYYGYMNELKKASDTLAEYGVNHNSARSLMNMKTKFMEMSAPIVKAAQLKEEDAKVQAQKRMENPNNIVEDISKRDLWDYANNGYTSMGVRMVSPDKIGEDAKNTLGALARIEEEPRYKEIFMQNMLNLGYGVDEIRGLMLQVEHRGGLQPEDYYKNPLIQDMKRRLFIKHGVMDSDGNVADYINEDGFNRIDEGFNAGAYQGMGFRKYDTMNNPYITHAPKPAAPAGQEQKADNTHGLTPITIGNEMYQDSYDDKMFDNTYDGKKEIKPFIGDNADLRKVAGLLKNKNKLGGIGYPNSKDIKELRDIAERNHLSKLVRTIDSFNKASTQGQVSPTGGYIPSDAYQSYKSIEHQLNEVMKNTASLEIPEYQEAAGKFGVNQDVLSKKMVEFFNKPGDDVQINKYAFKKSVSDAITFGYSGMLYKLKEKGNAQHLGGSKTSIASLKDKNPSWEYHPTKGLVLVAYDNGKPTYYTPNNLSLGADDQKIAKNMMTLSISDPKNIIDVKTSAREVDNGDGKVGHNIVFQYNGREVEMPYSTYDAYVKGQLSAKNSEMVMRSLIQGLAIGTGKHEVHTGMFGTDQRPLEIAFKVPNVATSDPDEFQFLKITGFLVGEPDQNGNRAFYGGTLSSQAEGANKYKSIAYGLQSHAMNMAKLISSHYEDTESSKKGQTN